MASTYTTNLGLTLPTTGELAGTWGSTVNTGVTELLDSSIAGTTTLSADADVTLSVTDGAANQARSAVILWTASNGATPRNITVPSHTKAYIVINAGTGSIVVKGAATTGVTIATGVKALIAWNGSDFVVVAASVMAVGSITGLGTGVATALAVNVGSAGALVANGGALGTPSSGTLTNATGLPPAGVTGTALVAAAIGTTVQAYDADLTTWAGVTPGTGVATALAVAVGSAGAPVVLNGAGGTPSSITLTNATGLPAAGVTGTAVTQTTLNNGTLPASFTTLSATGAGTIQGLTVGKGAGAVDTNTVVGVGALAANPTGAYQTMIGYLAGASLTSGNNFNTFTGAATGKDATGNGNSLFGATVGYSLSTGSGNTFLGFGSAAGAGAGYYVTSGSNNVIVGGFDGNADGLDIRTADEYVVLSVGAKRQITAKEGYSLALDSAVPVVGTGITFPATQNASANANTLDDYEEGTWTPANSSTSYSAQSGYYIKVGRLVTIWATFGITTLGGGSATIISGNPFTPVQSGTNAVGCVRYFSNLATSVLALCAYSNTGNTSIYFQANNSSGTTTTNSNVAILGSAAYVEFTITYQS
jgi:hypothetical protein